MSVEAPVMVLDVAPQTAPAEGAHDAGVAYDQAAFAEITGYGAITTGTQPEVGMPVGTVEAAAESGDLFALRDAIGALLMNVGARIGDTTLVREAESYNVATLSLLEQQYLASQLLGKTEEDEDDK